MFIRLYRMPVAILAAICTLFSFAASASPETDGRALADKISKAHLSGQRFTEATLFAPATGQKHAGVLDEETILQPLSNAVSSLFSTHPEAVSITVKTESGKAYTLEMMRSYPTGEHPDMGVYDESGRHAAPYTSGLHYQGALAGNDHSLATMSVFANGDVAILFANDEGNFVLGKLEDGSGKYIFYNDRSLHGHRTACATPDPPAGVTSQDGIKTAKTAKNLLCSKVRLYWEVAYQLYTYKSSNLTNVQNYVTALFNQVQAMYANENIAVELAGAYVWTTADSYPVTASDAALYSFQAYWNTMQAGFGADAAHLLTRTTNNNLGGVAFVDVLCNPGINYAFSDVSGLSTVPAVPTYSWDVEVVTHETGHNFGSKHTHWCGWMTGSGGTCGAIDNCYTLESTTTCSSCSSTTNYNTAPAGWQGTVMSYCHLTSRGINLANGFGTLPGAAIRNSVSTSACLSPLINATLTPSPVCNNDGGITLQFTPNNFGVAPYTFNWNTGAKTQDLTNLSSAGTYSVSISDNGGCSQQLTTFVGSGLFAGQSQNPSITMPVCCNSYNAPLILNAAPPQGLTSCQTIYWLRSSAAITNLTEAQAYFDTASAVNALKSSNESSIANGTVGASLNVTPEPCTSTQTWYYTPVVVQLAHAADSFLYYSTGSSTYVTFPNNVSIGGYTTIADQSTSPNYCDLLDTATSKSLTVSVNSYTGRANKMRIYVLDANDEVLFQSGMLTGNGTYTIPTAAIAGNFLQGMKVVAIDYNCTVSGTSQSCTSSQATVSAARKIVFGYRKAKVVADCAISPSTRIDYAPAGCSMLSVLPTAVISGLAVVPNPATSFVTLKFNVQQASQVEWKISDVAGRTMLQGNRAYGAGAQATQIDLHELPRGIYFVNLGTGHGASERVKLILQ